MKKLMSWNVNGLRACLNKGFLDTLAEQAPDVLCLQETKLQPEQVDFELPGYHVYWHSCTIKKGYSGTAILSREEPLSLRYGIGREEIDGEGRVLTAEYGDWFLVTVYSPNAQRELVRLSFRMAFEDAFRAYLTELRKEKPVIICGDMNVAHRPIDLKNPKPNIGNAGFSYEERGKFSELLATGLLDTYRHFYPDKAEAYSWWSYMNKARDRNIGWRIDYFLADQRLEPQLEDALILPQITGSDHCPVALLLR